MKLTIPAILVLGLALQGCTTATSEEGLHAEIRMVNEKSKMATVDVGSGTTKQFVRNEDGKQFQLETGLLNVLASELIPCSAVLTFNWLNPLSSAYAHGADEVPPGGVLDVSQEDGSEQALGEVAIAPGEYCAVRVSLAPVMGTTPVTGAVDMNGNSLYVNACYYYKSGSGGDTSAHYCFPLRVAGASEERVLELPEPFTVDATERHVEITISVNYDKWFDRVASDDAFSALDGYGDVVGNPPCVVADTATYNATSCTAAKNAFKAGLQAHEDLLDLLAANVLDSLGARLE